MPTVPPRFQGIRIFGRIALGGSLLAAMTLLVYGGYSLWGQDETAGLLVLAVGLLALTGGILLYGQLALLHRTVNITYRMYDALLDSAQLDRQHVDLTRTIAENSSLSDYAKRIVYRERDYEHLRDSIQSAIVKQHWDDVHRFIRELDEEFGLHEEAARLREEVQQAQQATTEEKITAALDRFEKLCREQKWERARNESRRLRTLFPDDSRITGLEEEVGRRREHFKQKLLKAYDVAVRIQNVDEAHRLLLELDKYISPDEVAVLKDSARNVFKARLFQLGVQFSLAVTDKKFDDAVSIGERVIREYPNTRYAQEIKELLPALRKRAEHGSAAEAAT